MDKVHITARDVFGKHVPNINATIEEKRAGGSVHYLANVTAPGFLPGRAVLNFDLEAELLMLMDPDQRRWPDLEDAGRQLIGLVLRHTYVAGADVLGYTIGIVHVQPDRVYYVVRDQLLEDLERSAAFETANSDMHEPPDGFDWGEPLSSYKGRNKKAAPQLTMWRGNVAGVTGLEPAKRVILEAPKASATPWTLSSSTRSPANRTRASWRSSSPTTAASRYLGERDARERQRHPHPRHV
jgi:hypothetical protein